MLGFLLLFADNIFAFSFTQAVMKTIYRATPQFAGYLDVGPAPGVLDGKYTATLWIALAICFSITTGVTAYVGRLVSVIKDARRKLFRRMKKEKETQLDLLTEQNDTN